MPPRAVLDTTIVVSAIRSRNGVAAAALDFVLAGRVVLLLDYPLSCEYREVALRPEHTANSHLAEDEIHDFLDTLNELAESVHIEVRHRPLSVDPDDNLVLDVAINGRADMIVTTNIRHFKKPAARFGIEVIDAKTFLVRMRTRSGYVDPRQD